MWKVLAKNFVDISAHLLVAISHLFLYSSNPNLPRNTYRTDFEGCQISDIRGELVSVRYVTTRFDPAQPTISRFLRRYKGTITDSVSKIAILVTEHSLTRFL